MAEAEQPVLRPLAVEVGHALKATLELRTPGVHPWFAGLALGDMLAERGLRLGSFKQVGGNTWLVEVV